MQNDIFRRLMKSAFIFRCKPPLGASSPFTSAESALTFRCKPPLGARGIATVLERKDCEHVKSLAQSEATLSFEDIKDPSAEASIVGGKFFTDIWDNGGREMAQEIIQKSEKGIHDARKIAEAAEKSTEPEGQIGTS
jgi:hypothetical protein